MAGKAKIQYGTLVAGVLTALVIVVSQLFYFEKPCPVKKEVKTEQQQESSDQDLHFTLPSSTLPSSSTHVEFQQEIFCLFEILFEEKNVEEHHFNVSLPVSRFFRTLFHSIISPNAP